MGARADLGERIARARRAAGLSQSALGAACDVSGQQVHRWERGASIPGRDSLGPLAEALGIEWRELYDLAFDANKEDKDEVRRDGHSQRQHFNELWAEQRQHVGDVLAEVRSIVHDNRVINETILHRLEELTDEFVKVRKLLETLGKSASR